MNLVPASGSGDRPLRKRRVLSCLPCRIHKLRCDRGVPCQSCSRHGRQDQCRLNPSPATMIQPIGVRTKELPELRAYQNTASASASTTLPSITQGETKSEDDVHASIHASGTTEERIAWAQNQKSRTSVDSCPQETGSTSHFPPSADVASIKLRLSLDSIDCSLLDEPDLHWRKILIYALPRQSQCDMLISYFFENIHWMNQSIHGPSFRSAYAELWTTHINDIRLPWLALLYTILALSAVHIPTQLVEAAGFEVTDMSRLTERWFSASQQALHAGGREFEPELEHVQVFVTSQLYCLVTKKVEALNIHLGQAVRAAQALGLDKESPPSVKSYVERELRHRAWWDLASTDTFHSLNIGRQPLIQSYLSSVPFPLNCNDTDITPERVNAKPPSEPTFMSGHRLRCRLFKCINRLCINNGANMASYDFVAEIDDEMRHILDAAPWYFRNGQSSEREILDPYVSNLIGWHHHFLHTFVCVQRLRMFRPFLNPPEGDSWQRCCEASSSALSVYKSMRSLQPSIVHWHRSPKAYVGAYQILSPALSLATFLLVEQPSNTDNLRADIDMVLDDIHAFNNLAAESHRLQLFVDGEKAIRIILRLYDERLRLLELARQNQGTGGVQSAPYPQEAAAQILLPTLSAILGGESTARQYLQRCTIRSIVNDSEETDSSQMRQSQGGANTDGTAVPNNDYLEDGRTWDYWDDRMWEDLNSAILGSQGFSA